MRNLKDTIYEDDEYILIVKEVDAIGHFEPSSLLGIISIATVKLQQWSNFGCKYRKDAEGIIQVIKKNLELCLDVDNSIVDK